MNKKLDLFNISIFVCVYLVLCTNAYSQERVNKSMPVVSERVLWSLNNAKGWILSPDGQWLEENNKIQRENLSASQKDIFEKDINITGYDNFIEIQARDIKIEGNDFLLITKKYIRGGYKYPGTATGFIPEVATSFAVVKKNNAIYDTKYGNAAYVMPIFYYGTVLESKDDFENISLKINAMAIANPWISTSRGTTNNIEFHYKEVKEDPSKCRFFIKSSMDVLPNLNESLMLPIRTATFKKEILTNFYYEIPVNEMSGLITLIKAN